MPEALTERDLEAIRERFQAHVASGGAASAESAADVPTLLSYAGRLEERLTDCWLLLNEVARAREPGRFGAAAAKLLHAQSVPGWKETA